MKKRIPKVIGKKLRGEWAEMRFMVRIAELALPISKPWGDSRSFDFVVGRPRHFKAVQVKSTTFALEEGWMCSIGSCSKPYPPGSFDFLAAYVVFEDAWYIIPEEKILGMKSISLHTNNNHSKYESYRENWELLQRAVDAEPDADAEPGYVDDIQGCAKEFSTEAAQLMSPQAYTKVSGFARDDNHARDENRVGNSFGRLFRRIISLQRLSY
jgi:hypothetical protein